MSDSFILSLSCKNRPGIVARVTAELFSQGGNILEAHQYDDIETGRLFTRIGFNFSGLVDESVLKKKFDPIARQFGMEWTIRPKHRRSTVLILASKFDHCLVDLLYRARFGELKMDIVGIISIHPREMYSSSDFAEIPFHYLPVTQETKSTQESQIMRVVEATGTELVVLARYVQILSDKMASFLSGRCINIHHSFLPGFKGARPYHQAHGRGVKLIGATAHYVTADLDEGPIIEQDVERISHDDSPEDLVRKGRDIERRVLARAVTFHLEGRALVNGHKTVVFRN